MNEGWGGTRVPEDVYFWLGEDAEVIELTAAEFSEKIAESRQAKVDHLNGF